MVASLAVAPPLAFASTASIAGTSYQDLNRNGVRDSGEAAWSAHELYLFDDAGRFVATTLTGSDGRYAFSGLAPGAYRLQYSSSSWDPLRLSWVPTTTGSLRPRHDVALTTTMTADFGLRPIVRSTDVSKPITVATSPAGLRVESFDDVVPASAVLAALDSGTLRGAEQPSTVVRFDYHTNSFCGTSVGGTQGSYSGFSASCYVSYASWIDGGDRSLFHEYGHAWSTYYAHIVQQDSEFATYLEVRGLTGDSRLDTNHSWDRREMIAEDYRQLFGSATAAAPAQENREIPAAKDVPALREFLSGAFMDGTQTGQTPPPSNAAPTAAVVQPLAGSTVSGATRVSVEAADAEDLVSQLRVEVSIDGAPWQPASYDAAFGRHALSWDTTAAANGTHAVATRVTDSAGATTSGEPVTVNVSNSASSPVHVSDLAGSASVSKRLWSAVLTVTLADSGGAPVPGATVTVTWKPNRGTGGTLSCLTGSTATCSVPVSVSSKTTSVSFTVADVAGPGLVYDSAANTDATGDSNGSSILVARPA